VPVTESTPLIDDETGRPSYDQSKARGERIVAEAVRQGLDAVVLAPTGVVGPHDYRPSRFGQVLLALARNRMPLVISGGFDWVDVRDVVAAALRAEEAAPSGSKYLLSGHWLSLMDVARLAGNVTGSSVSCTAVPLPLARACAPLAEASCRLTGRTPLFTRYSVEALSQHRTVSHDKATRDLAYRPRAFDETLTDTYRWFTENGYLPSNAPGGAGHL
jgi:dihydroflavonol-4-reductase